MTPNRALPTALKAYEFLDLLPYELFGERVGKVALGRNLVLYSGYVELER